MDIIRKKILRTWLEGEHFVWMSGAALAITLLIAATLVVVVMINGLGVFWPSDVVVIMLNDGSRLMGEIKMREKVTPMSPERIQLKIGNRDLYGLDFRWTESKDIARIECPVDAMVLKRREYGNFYGFLKAAPSAESPVSQTQDSFSGFERTWKEVYRQAGKQERLRNDIASINNALERIRLRLLRLTYDGYPENSTEARDLHVEQTALKEQFSAKVAEQEQEVSELRKHVATFEDIAGTEITIPMVDIMDYYQPNSMSWWAKGVHYLRGIRELLWEDPRESNTEGGLYPAIFGTIILVFLMSIFSFPFGVIAGVYLREYAQEGMVLRIVRIAVNNLAGIPSIVYGIFGLGFFVLGIGGAIDRFFFPERLPAPTFGTGGILWASLTLGLLTVPVVIVATEEALGAIPKGIREASLSLGATKFQTLLRLLVPMASPGIMTGFILAMARAAGEVAPLMITGVVKLAAALPVDGTFPYVHAERKFMHLGFHIYDIGFQSPNVEAVKPMVFVTTMLLLLIVLLMNSAAIHLRNRMRKRYSVKSL